MKYFNLKNKDLSQFTPAGICLLLITLLFSGCTAVKSDQKAQRNKSTGHQTAAAKNRPEVKAVYTPTPIKVDGILDEEIWKNTPTYSMVVLGKKPITKPKEKTTIRLAWDDNYFYVAAECHDSDIVAKGKKDGMSHYALGDVIELFMKPEKQTWYWEMYSTPASKKTTFWFVSRGRKGIHLSNKEIGLRVHSTLKGTLNNWHDKDVLWITEMAVPLKELKMENTAFAPGANWRILISRYNYSRYFSAKELSCYPALRRYNFHYYEDYASLILEKK